MLQNDTLSRLDLDELILVRIFLAVWSVKGKTPEATFAKVEFVERAREAVRTPPPRQKLRLRPRPVDLFPWGVV